MWVYLKEAVGVMLLYNLIDHSSFAELRRLVPLVKSMNVPAVMIGKELIRVGFDMA